MIRIIVLSFFLFFGAFSSSGQVMDSFGCFATDGTDEGQPCVFPFRYGGVLHNKCTTDWWTADWCATQTDQDHSVIEWGHCRCQEDGDDGACNDGYKRQADSEECVDIDECSSDIHNCSEEENCINTVGSWRCCLPGSCTDTDKTLIPGVIIAGSTIWNSDEVGVSVEVFNPHTRHSCNVTDLPGGVRWDHSLCGPMLCGGGESSTTERSCLKLNPLTGAFSPTSVRLVKERRDHLCWEVEGEGGPTLLLGGHYSGLSTELVSSDGLSSTTSFPLQYDTDMACGIVTGDKYVITGGRPGLRDVTRYSRTGDQETLAQLNVGRYWHACGSYLTHQGENNVQVLIVTGGRNTNDGLTPLDSTEVLEVGGTWRLTDPLPSARSGLRAAVLDNNIFVFGGWDMLRGSAELSDILQYNTTSHTWEEVGQMKEARDRPAVGLLVDVSNLCP